MQAYDDYEDEGLTCHTAPGVTFTTMDELKEHYRSDWHRYNLKRKVAGLPVVGRELFERVMAQAGAASAGKKETGRDHLKRPEEMPRSVARAKRMEEWVENHREEIEAAQAAEAERERRIAAGEDLSDEEDYEEDDAFDEEEDDDSGWESMSDDEAQEVLARMERMAAEDESDDESDDEAEGMELDLSNAPVRLAEKRVRAHHHARRRFQGSHPARASSAGTTSRGTARRTRGRWSSRHVRRIPNEV